MPQPAPLTVAVTPGTVREGWCLTCKARTLLTGELLLLTPHGVTVAGEWAWCEICDDPADQEDNGD